jgi:hypothetical protein
MSQPRGFYGMLFDRKSLPLLHLVIYVDLRFMIGLKPAGGEHSQNVDPDSAITYTSS